MTQGYAFNFDGHGVFTPDGRADILPADVDRHNREIEATEIARWQTQPDQWQVYVMNGIVTTWLGTKLGTITRSSTYTNNLGARITSIRILGTNGATYYGRFGSDWSLCWVRKLTSASKKKGTQK